jgi:hypothetical protein
MILRTPADDAFSRCVRARVEYHCEICWMQHGETSHGLGASHHFGRAHWGVRFHPLNAESACTACHYRVGGTHDRMVWVLGPRLEELRELRDDKALS